MKRCQGRIQAAFGPVDILVNNAAFDQPDSFLPPQEIQKDPLFVEEYPMQPIRAESHDRPRIDGAYAHACNVSYGASKLAMESYTRAAAQELGPYGITVNVVSPGAVQTGWMPEKLAQTLSENYPLRRVGRPEDIAQAVLFFASRQAGWITGQVLFVGGGNRM